MSQAQRSQRAQAAGNAVRDRYGLAYYAALAKAGSKTDADSHKKEA